MKTIMIYIAGFAGAMGGVAGAAGNSSLAPLTLPLTPLTPMFVPDIPNVPDQYLPVLVAEVRPAATTSPGKEMTIGVCRPVPNVLGGKTGGDHAINPIPEAINYLWSFEEYFKHIPEEQRRAALGALESSGKVTILQLPKYGTLTNTAKPYFPEPYPNLFFYNPKPGYMGKDQVIFLV